MRTQKETEKVQGPQIDWYTPGNIEKLRTLLSQPLAVQMAMMTQQAAWQIIAHFIMPEVTQRIKCDKFVRAGQVIFPPGAPPLVQFNEEVTRPEQGMAYVTVFFSKTQDDRLKINIQKPNLAPILPALLKPPIPGLKENQDIVLNNCLACGVLFIPEPNHPHQKYCSTTCRERAQKRRYRERLKKNEPPQKKK